MYWNIIIFLYNPCITSEDIYYSADSADQIRIETFLATLNSEYKAQNETETLTDKQNKKIRIMNNNYFENEVN